MNTYTKINDDITDSEDTRLRWRAYFYLNPQQKPQNIITKFRTQDSLENSS